MTTIGYVRVSTKDQNVGLQTEAMASAKVDRIYTDQGVSGSLASRPEFDKALDRLEAGDILVVWKLDRLGRNTKNVLEVIDRILAKGAKLHSLTENIDLNSGPMGRAMVTIMAAFAQLERDTISERTRAGLDAARAKGKLGGRPPKVDSKSAAKIKKLVASGDYTRAEIANMMHISQATLYRVLANS